MLSNASSHPFPRAISISGLNVVSLLLLNSTFTIEFNVYLFISLLRKLSGNLAPHLWARLQTQGDVACTYSGGQCPCGGCIRPRALYTSSCAASSSLSGARRSSRRCVCTVCNLNAGQYSLVVLHVLDEGASGVVGAED